MKKEISSSYTALIGRHLDEKLKPWTLYLAEHKGEELNILDIGSAGGDFVASLVPHTARDQKVWGIDSEEEYVTQTASVIGERSKLGNACDIPFEDNYFDAVNCSSLLHEVYTYGYKSLTGLEALRESINEMKRVMKEDAVLFYRDVLAPTKRDCYKVEYRSLSLQLFIDRFLPIFIDTDPLLYQGNYTLQRNPGTYLLYGSSFLHREIQKHFLLCLDNISEAILSRAESTAGTDERCARLVHLEVTLSSLLSEVTHREFFTGSIDTWLQREGREKYLYLTANEFVDFCAMDTHASGYALLPATEPSTWRQMRPADNLFLQSILGNPEEEGKQCVLFTKRAIN